MSDEQLVAYFIEQTNNKFQSIERKLDDLMAFKWKVIGLAIACSFAVSLTVEIIAK